MLKNQRINGLKSNTSKTFANEFISEQGSHATLRRNKKCGAPLEGMAKSIY